jgi:peptidoglycan/LPS O-acetylase OafA/YrhL
MGGLLDGMGILWSLCVEEHFYFLFPIVFLMVIKFSWKISWVFLIIILIMLAWRYLAYFHLNFEKDYFYYASEIKAIYIIAGSLLAIYFISNNSDSKKLSSTDITLLWGSLALLFASYFWGNSDAYRFFWRDLLHVFLLWIIFRFVLMYPQYKYFKFLETKIAKFIGKISYVLYLSHMAFVYLIAKYIELSPLLNFIFVFFISVLFAWIVLQIVERPSSKIKNTILKKYLQEK